MFLKRTLHKCALSAHFSVNSIMKLTTACCSTKCQDWTCIKVRYRCILVGGIYILLYKYLKCSFLSSICILSLTLLNLQIKDKLVSDLEILNSMKKINNSSFFCRRKLCYPRKVTKSLATRTSQITPALKTLAVPTPV